MKIAKRKIILEDVDPVKALIEIEYGIDKKAFEKFADMLSDLPKISPRTEEGEILMEAIDLNIDTLTEMIYRRIKTF